jgi:hypothetical protein
MEKKIYIYTHTYVHIYNDNIYISSSYTKTEWWREDVSWISLNSWSVYLWGSTLVSIVMWLSSLLAAPLGIAYIWGWHYCEEHGHLSILSVWVPPCLANTGSWSKTWKEHGPWHTRSWNGPQEKLLIVLPDVYGHRSVCLMCFRHELKWEYGKPFPRSTHGKTVELRSPRSQIPCWIPMIPMIPGKQERHKSNFCCLNPFVYCSYCKTWPI